MEKAGKQGSVLHIAIYFLAITALFCVYSLIQERLITIPFGAEEELFEYSVFIVLINRFVTCAVAAAALRYLNLPLAPSAPPLLFAIPSVANVVGSSAQYEALKYVSFPLQALAKCAKSVPVMAWSWVTRTRVYNRSDYLSAATVVLGCMLFVLTGDITAPNPQTSAAATAVSNAAASLVAPALSFTATGLALLSIFMIFDGLTCTSQDKLFSSYDMHSCNQLLYTAAWSASLSAGFLLISGQMWGALAFVARHPGSLGLMLAQSVVSTAVQLFIVFTIKQYGALNFALMMTLRQFLSIVLSCLVFQHQLSAVQWGGTLLVFGGLIARSVDKSTAVLRRGAGEKLMQTSQHKPSSLTLSFRSPKSPSASNLDGDWQSSPFVGLGNEEAASKSPVKAKHVGGLGSSPHPHTSLSSALLGVAPGGSPTVANRPLNAVLQPLSNVFYTPLRGPPLSPSLPGSCDLKHKPG